MRREARRSLGPRARREKSKHRADKTPKRFDESVFKTSADKAEHDDDEG